MSHSTSESDSGNSSDPPTLKSSWRWSKGKEIDQEKLKKAARAQRFSGLPLSGNLRKPTYGFVSRGSESELQQSEHAQREYFDSILETFKAIATENQECRWKTQEDYSNDTRLSILTNLRKLREALLHQEPSDFTKKVHLFSVRVSSAIGHFQTYVPSINYLMHEARHLLTDAEHREIMTLRVLHLSHKNGANNKALETLHEHLDEKKDSRVFLILLAWILGDYVQWILIYNSESDHGVYCAMTQGLPQMMKHMILCFSKTFFTYRYDDFVSLLPQGMSWLAFQQEYTVPWSVQDDVITIRRRGR